MKKMGLQMHQAHVTDFDSPLRSGNAHNHIGNLKGEFVQVAKDGLGYDFEYIHPNIDQSLLTVLEDNRVDSGTIKFVDREGNIGQSNATRFDVVKLLPHLAP